ncbi:uncharacterized protein LOC118274622 [Spodoptera frugiperda]|uniref:Uncharacterized protein LOC118274622 n=1 Tax=Spodoptera frugiperda TaxID=7108 RepID=A0A9R0DTF6_SPOFR|nr:uncharacterized protein LOC118274622 [Spodoptera frugiperda]
MKRCLKVKGILYVFLVAFTLSVDFTSAQLRENGTKHYNNERRLKNKSQKQKPWDVETLQNDGKLYERSQDNVSVLNIVDQAMAVMNARRYHSNIPYENTKLCHIIASTYLASVPDLRRHYNLRHFYQGNLEYEVGYLVNEILTKYQRMLEIFHIAQSRFYNHQNENFITSNYMLYLYTNVLTLGKGTGSLCNSLTELGIKYKGLPATGFEDYHIKKKKKTRRPHSSFTMPRKYQDAVDEYERKLHQGKKRRRRKRKRDRFGNLYIGYVPTRPPWKNNFRLVYYL